MKKIYSPNDELELSMIRGILESEGIHFFILNDHFGSMRVGPQIEMFNKKAIMVAAKDLDRASELIASFLEIQLNQGDEQEQYSLSQKLRMILEMLLFGWFVPGKKRSKSLPRT